jgi:hypothetical protein
VAPAEQPDLRRVDRDRGGEVSVAITQVVAQTSAFVGVVAGFWHILWIAGVAVLISGLAGWRSTPPPTRLEQDQGPTPPEADGPGEAGS